MALLPETEFGVLAISPDCRTVAVVCRDDIRLWDLITCTEVERIPVTHRLLGYNPPLAFSPDGMRLVVGCADTTAVVWDVSSARRRAASAQPLTAKDRDALWNDLADDDAAKAYAAIDRLAARPGARDGPPPRTSAAGHRLPAGEVQASARRARRRRFQGPRGRRATTRGVGGSAGRALAGRP